VGVAGELLQLLKCRLPAGDLFIELRRALVGGLVVPPGSFHGPVKEIRGDGNSGSHSGLLLESPARSA
jgi:hypothetical protein